MNESAFEKYFLNKRASLTYWVRDRDRFVLVALVLAILPLPPACFLAAIISAFNIWLLAAGQLDKAERWLVILALILSIANSVLCAKGLMWVYQNIDDLPSHLNSPYIPDFIERVIDWVNAYLQWLYGDATDRGTPV